MSLREKGPNSTEIFLYADWKRRFTLRENSPYSELFWSAFSRIRTEYEEILHISPYSVRMRENADQNNSKYGPFLRSVTSEISVFSSKMGKYGPEKTPYLDIFHAARWIISPKLGML